MIGLNELILATRSEMKIDRVGRIWGDADVIDALKDSIFQLQKDGSFRWQFNKGDTTITTVTGQAEYSFELFPNFQSAEVVQLNGKNLISRQKEEIIRDRTIDNSTGGAIFYYLYDSNVGVVPTPTNSTDLLRVVYNAILILNTEDIFEDLQDTDGEIITDIENNNIQVLTALGNIFDINPLFKRVIILYASYILFTQTSDSKNFTRAEIKLKRYNETLGTLFASYIAPDKNQWGRKTSYRSPSHVGITRRNRRIVVID